MLQWPACSIDCKLLLKTLEFLFALTRKALPTIVIFITFLKVMIFKTIFCLVSYFTMLKVRIHRVRAYQEHPPRESPEFFQEDGHKSIFYTYMVKIKMPCQGESADPLTGLLSADAPGISYLFWHIT